MLRRSLALCATLLVPLLASGQVAITGGAVTGGTVGGGAAGAVSFDATTQSHSGTPVSFDETSFSWSHTGGSSPEGVIVFVTENGPTDAAPSVTYGGNSMAEIVQAEDTADEAGRTTAFFLGSSVPTGTQTIVVSRNNNSTEMWAVAISVDSTSSSTETTGAVLLEEDGTLSEQNVDDGSPGANSLRTVGGMFGHNTPPSVGSNTTLAFSIDLGFRSAGAGYETTPGQGSRPVGFSAASDDRAVVHIAIRGI